MLDIVGNMEVVIMCFLYLKDIQFSREYDRIVVNMKLIK